MEFGESNCCILASYAIQHVLRQLEFENVNLLRVICDVSPSKSEYGVVLGNDGNGSRRPKTPSGMWNGHLVTTVGRKWILDATLDQVNDQIFRYTCDYDQFVKPLLGELSPEFWDNTAVYFNVDNKTSVQYSIFKRQVGFKNASHARRSHWMPIAEKVLGLVLLMQQLLKSKRRKAVTGNEEQSILRSMLYEDYVQTEHWKNWVRTYRTIVPSPSFVPDCSCSPKVTEPIGG
jgi:hypothetical protein